MILRHHHIIPCLLTTVILLLGSLTLFGSPRVSVGNNTDSTTRQILESLQKLDRGYPQQKVFLHTNKDDYLAGEDLFLKAYVVDTGTHKRDTLSTNLYVDLFDAEGDIVSTLLLRLKNGTAHATISLPDSLPEGSYRVTAYTNWMKNFNEDLFFSKDIAVYNPIEENFIRFWDILKKRVFNRRLQREQDEMQFAVFPEGGHLVSGVENRVAFKAANALGEGVAATGSLLDGQENKIASFETFHNGMGSFKFTPEKETTYTAHIAFANGNEKTIHLPLSNPQGYMLSVSQENSILRLEVESNFDHNTVPGSNEVILFGHTRGKSQFLYEATLSDNSFVKEIPVEELPEGICHITLFTPGGEPIAERLAFINTGKVQEAEVTASLVNNDNQNKVHVRLTTDAKPQSGSFSVAVLDKEAEQDTHGPTIATEFLLFSDLDYITPDPGYYLQSDSKEAAKAADLIMLTHGWRRFDWANILDGAFPEITYGFRRGITFSGQVTPKASARETGELDLELAISDNGITTYTTTTDRKGHFVFADLEHYGVITADLYIEEKLPRRAMRVKVESKKLEGTAYEKNLHTQPFRVTSRGDDWERVSRPKTTLRTKRVFEPSRGTHSIYNDVDQVIYFDDIHEQYSSIMGVIRNRVHGLRIINGEITLRGSSSMMYSSEPLFLVDEVMVHRSTFLNLGVQEVERLAVIRGAQSAILGSRGANGALLIYTRRGDGRPTSSYEYLLKGFHEPDETFKTSIHEPVYLEKNIARTVFWDPAIQPDEKGVFTFSYSADEQVRQSKVIFQGINHNGQLYYTEKYLNNEVSEQ